MEKTIIFIVGSIVLMGCSIKSEIAELESTTTTIVKEIFGKTSATEINSGARGKYLTNDNYSVSYSVGNMGGKLETTTVDGYKVYLNVQGSVFSESH